MKLIEEMVRMVGMAVVAISSPCIIRKGVKGWDAFVD